MKPENHNERRRLDRFGETIVNVSVRAYFNELIDILSNLHEDVTIHGGVVDLRAELGGRTICRLVPYRELIHLHIGEKPVWEVRVRDEEGYFAAIDRILEVFLSFSAADNSVGTRYIRGTAVR